MKKSNLLPYLLSYIIFAVVLMSAMPAKADRQAKLLVTDQQMQKLGITTAPLRTDAAPVISSLPAQVIIPPDKEEIVSAPFDGLATQLFVQKNQVVKKGAPLIRMVSPELGQLQLNAVQAASRAGLARQAMQRDVELFNEGIISQRRVNESQAAYKESDAALQYARTALRMSGFSAQAINQLISSGKPEESVIIRATKSGAITEVEVKPGQRVASSTSLMHLAQTDVLWLDIHVPAAQVANWRSAISAIPAKPAKSGGSGVKLKIQGHDITARLVSMGSNLSAASQSVIARAVVDAGAHQLLVGEFVTVELPVTSAMSGWNVPLSAIAYEDGQAYVFVRNADGFEVCPVTVVASAGQRVYIKEMQAKRKAGEEIAINNITALKAAWLNSAEAE